MLGLAMIVKNEAHGIRETLESFKPFIDRWTILDTGSTDGTQDVIKSVLGDLPGTLCEEPFVDFATSRNRALDLHGKTTPYVIMPDSDDRLVNGEAFRGFLSTAQFSSSEVGAAPAFLVNLRRGNLSYFLPIVLSTEHGWRYHGVVHEYIGPVTGDGFAEIKIPDVQITQDFQPVSAEASRKRWERDLTLLHAELVAKPNDPRALFYLGQTYECLSKPELGLAMYRSRIAVGGWAEETFEAHLRCAKILQAMGRPWPEVQQAYLDAFRFNPKRAEPLFKIAEHWYCEDAHHLAYLFASRAAELPRPTATLFVDEEVYTWRAADIVAISGYYLDDPASKLVGRKFADQCVRVHPGDERLRSNRAFYSMKVDEMFEGYQSKPIGFTPDEPWVPYNPSVHFDGKRWRCIVRTSNYKIVDGQYLTPDDNIIYTRNFMIDLDADLNTVKATEMIDKTGIERSAYPVHGFEDCRLFNHEGKLVFTSTVCDFDLDKPNEGPREIVLGELDEGYAIVAATPLRGPWSPLSQKNWMPTGDGRLIYSATPDANHKATVMTLADRKITGVTPHPFNGHHGRLRGGSQAVRVPEGWLCIIHDVAWPGARMYLHRFVLLSESFEVVSMTDLFYFTLKGIEFCAGLALDGKRLVASFGVEDKKAIFGIFDLDVVRAQLRTNYQI